MSNLYWAIYNNLEKEILNLADLIHFDDKQLNVYSVRIADLLVRCAVEIEAISKELYELKGGDMNPVDNNGNSRTLFFDTDCLEYFENTWALGEKQVIVSNANIYFEDENNRILTPLKNANKRGKCDWKTTYQAVKHNRGKNLEQGNIKSLLRALAALYILNVYYKGETFVLNNLKKLPDECLGSKIFSVKTAVCSPRFPDFNIDLNEAELCAIYIIKPTNVGYSAYYRDATTGFRKQKDAIIAAGYEIVKNEDDENEDIVYADIYKIAVDIGGAELVKRISDMEQPALKIYSSLNYEAVLNTSTNQLFAIEN